MSYSTVTEYSGCGVYSKPQSYFATQIDFLQILIDVKDKFNEI